MRAPWRGIRQGEPNPVVLGRKFCARCGRWRLVATEFDWQKARPTRPAILRSYCRVCTKVRNKETVANRTEEQRELRREYHRIWAEVQRRRAGIPPRDYCRPTVVDQPSRVFFDPKPLLEEVDRYIEVQRRIDDRYGYANVAFEAGINERKFYEWRTGTRVELDNADRIAMAVGVSLYSIYPD